MELDDMGEPSDDAHVLRSFADLVDPEMIPYKLLKENFKAWKEEAAAQEAAAAAGKLSATT